MDIINMEKWHIAQIHRCRRELSRLLASGESLTSPRLVKLVNRLTDHCLKADLM